jgi:hypothetical protein
MTYLGHEFKTPFYPRQGLFIQNPCLVRGHDSWVHKPQKHSTAYCTNAVLGESLAHHLEENRRKYRVRVEENRRKYRVRVEDSRVKTTIRMQWTKR